MPIFNYKNPHSMDDLKFCFASPFFILITWTSIYALEFSNVNLKPKQNINERNIFTFFQNTYKMIYRCSAAFSFSENDEKI